MAGKPRGTVIRRGVPFTQIPNAAIEDTSIDVYAFRIFSYLMRLANSEGVAWPGQRTISERTGIARNTVADRLEQLEAAGWVDVLRSKAGNRYTVHGELLEDMGIPTGSPDEPPVVRAAHQGGAPDEPQVAHAVSPTNTHDQHPVPTLAALPPATCQLCAEIVCDWDCPNPEHREQEAPDWDRLEPEWEMLTSTWRFDLPAETEGQRKRVGRLAHELRTQADPELTKAGRWMNLNLAASRWPALFPGATLTPEALAKHYRALMRDLPMRASEAQNETSRARQMLRSIDGGKE